VVEVCLNCFTGLQDWKKKKEGNEKNQRKKNKRNPQEKEKKNIQDTAYLSHCDSSFLVWIIAACSSYSSVIGSV
jgi:hypothetical protein